MGDFLEFNDWYPYGYANFDSYGSCCIPGGYLAYIQNFTVDWGDGTTNSSNSHQYTIPGTYYVTGSFYCLNDSTFYSKTIPIVLECPSSGGLDYYWNENLSITDGVSIELINYTSFPNVIDSITWGDESVSYGYGDTTCSNCYMNFPQSNS